MMEKNWHNLETEKVAGILKTDIKEGLTEKEVKERQKKFGPNELPAEQMRSWLHILFDQLKNPLIYILLAAGIVTLALKDYPDTIIIFGVVVLNTAIGFFQEYKTLRVLQALHKIVKVKAWVTRSGNEKELDQEALVPGDVFLLHPGDKVPADGRLIEVHHLKINESALTGEWVAAEKKTDIFPEDTPLADRDNMVYMGTVVEDGRGKAMVTEIGERTEIGKIATLVKEVEEETTPYQKKVANFSKILGLVILFLSFLIFVFGMATGKEIREMLVTSIAIAVAAIPEGLPAAVTVTFAFGMQAILKRKGLVRKMVATETLGSASVICTDKTGTLTRAKMQVDKIYPEKNNFLALKIGTLCSEAFIENPDEPLEKWVVRGRPTEKALLVASIQAGLNKKELEKDEPKIDELPFDPVYKYSASLHKTGEDQGALYVLGAPEIILGMAQSIEVNGKKETLSVEEIRKLREKVEELAAKGRRVLATAYKRLKIKDLKVKNLEELCQEITFVGFIALHDPLRKEAKEAITTCLQAGMKAIIVTGDHKLTARAIAQELGLPAKPKNILEGKDLDKMSDKEFEEKLPEIEIFARVEPRHKIRIIEFWQEKGEVVAMTGDGVNDAPALRRADIGVALGSGTEVAKAASDLILLSDNFTVIVAAVREGRRIIDNVRKIITYLLEGGFAEIMIIGLSVIFRLPLPVLPGQILWKNLIQSTPPAMTLTAEKEEKEIMQRPPEDPKLPLLTGEMKFIIFIIGTFTNLLLFGLFLWLLFFSGFRLPAIQSTIFAGLVVADFFVIFSIRNLRKNIWQYNPFENFYLNGIILLGFLLLLAAIYLPAFQGLLKTVPLGIFEWTLLFILGLINLILIELAKWYYITKSKNKIK